MEVINTTEFAPTEFLVGQQKKTLSHGVADDAALMAMLSTGFYATPMRTMIQEMLFNAWDAHKMVGKEDIPIDVYINETSGLIIRDYGPGIEPGEENINIHGTYCIYGYSSKRLLPGQTGGFGLGSKSPFAYTDSFTITSFYEGTKNMYLIRRVAENNNGKPGFTPLMCVPTEETGLMVIIPLQKGHTQRAYDYIKDLLFLSGIKMNLHFEDQEPEILDNPGLEPGNFQIEAEPSDSKLIAVFGGVRYAIKLDDYFDDEYQYLNKFLGNSHTLFIGFAPNTMTPLPNREGLNMNDKTKETIKVVLETYIERFQLLVQPLLKNMLQVAVDHICTETKDPIMALYRCLIISRDGPILGSQAMEKLHVSNAPTDVVDLGIWKMAARLLNTKDDYQINVLSSEEWYKIVFKSFIYSFPDQIRLLRKVEYLSNRWKEKYRLNKTNVKAVFSSAFNENTILETIRIRHEWGKISKFPMSFRTKMPDEWRPIRLERPHHSTDDWADKHRKHTRLSGRLHRPATGNDVWYGGSRYDQGRWKTLLDDGHFFVPKTIILAKTKQVLDDFDNGQLFRMWKMEMSKYFSQERLLSNNSFFATVIHEKNGEFDKAVKFFENHGYLVMVCGEPFRVPKPVSSKSKRPEGYYIVNSRVNTWAGLPSMPQAPMTKDPEAFYYRTQTLLKEDASYRLPDELLMNWYLKRHPNTVVVFSATHEKMLLDRKIPKLEDVFLADAKKYFNDAKYFSLLSLVGWLKESFLLPHEMLEYPAIQKEFGVKIPRGKTLAGIYEDAQLMNNMMSCKLGGFDVFSIWLKDNYRYLGVNTKELRAKHVEFQLFNLERIGHLFNELPKEEHKAFIKKVLKTLKSF